MAESVKVLKLPIVGAENKTISPNPGGAGNIFWVLTNNSIINFFDMDLVDPSNVSGGAWIVDPRVAVLSLGTNFQTALYIPSIHKIWALRYSGTDGDSTIGISEINPDTFVIETTFTVSLLYALTSGGVAIQALGAGYDWVHDQLIVSSTDNNAAGGNNFIDIKSRISLGGRQRSVSSATGSYIAFIGNYAGGIYTDESNRYKRVFGSHPPDADELASFTPPVAFGSGNSSKTVGGLFYSGPENDRFYTRIARSTPNTARWFSHDFKAALSESGNGSYINTIYGIISLSNIKSFATFLGASPTSVIQIQNWETAALSLVTLNAAISPVQVSYSNYKSVLLALSNTAAIKAFDISTSQNLPDLLLNGAVTCRLCGFNRIEERNEYINFGYH